MAEIRNYKDLIAWQRAMELVKAVYLASETLPAKERFGLQMQMRRAAVSVPSNIAEGHGRRSRSDYVRFLDIARASPNELETQLLIAVQLRYLSDVATQPAIRLCEEVQRILRGLISSLERYNASGRTPKPSELRAKSSELGNSRPPA
jgi:four helix bundle protein